MNVFARTARMGRLSTALGREVLNLLQMDAEEHVNGLFTFRITALATTDDLSFDLAGTPCHAIIAAADMPGQDDNGWRNALTLRPWALLMSLRRKQQVHHGKTVLDILTEVFVPHGSNLRGDLPDLGPVFGGRVAI